MLSSFRFGFRFRRLALPVVAACALGGALVLHEGSASAQVVEVAPPAVRVEVAPRAPSPRHFWLPGYWGWRPREGYVWYGGRWEIARPGWVWERSHWYRDGGRWHFAHGHWHR
jgi:hypothetical protein